MDSTKSLEQPQQPLQPQPSSSSSFKVFKPRNSLLTDLIANNDHIKTLYNWILIFATLVVLATIVDYVNNPEKFQDEYSTFKWNFNGLLLIFRTWIIMNCVLIFLHYPLVLFSNFLQYRGLICALNSQKLPDDFDQAYQQWLQNRENFNWAPKVLCNLLFGAISIFGLLIFCPWSIFTYDLKIVGSLILMMEMTRLMMKAHSFYIEKKDLQLNREDFSTIFKSLNYREHGPILAQTLIGFWKLKSKPRLSCLLYYMMAPTLLYRDSYPRTEKIRWNLVRNNCFQFVIAVYLTYLSIKRFLLEPFSKTGLEPFEKKNLAYYLANMFITGLLFNLFSFYTLHHLWYNITAELLRFADRQFYGEWWNGRQLNDHYRKWNPIIQQWLLAYVYEPLKLCCSNRIIAAYSVILLSAIFHEIIIVVSLRFLLPAILFLFTIGNVLYILITRNAKSRILYSLNTILGPGLFCTLYTIEWYSRINCPTASSESLAQTLMPRMLNCVEIK